MRKRIKLSQNFLHNKKLIRSLIDKTLIKPNDLVCEIGAGQGIITEELVRKNTRVLAYEVDPNLYAKLVERYDGNSLVKLIEGDFLAASLPQEDYKVFSNIPFNLTAAIINKLLLTPNPLDAAYLIVQKEAAKKYIGKPYSNKNSLLSVLIKSQFDLSVIHEFRNQDFIPKPNVEIVMMSALKQVVIDRNDKNSFFDFVTFVFNQFEPNVGSTLKKILTDSVYSTVMKQYKTVMNCKPSEVGFQHWIDLFKIVKKSDKANKFHGAYKQLQKQQQNLSKIHRTRTARNWRTV